MGQLLMQVLLIAGVGWLVYHLLRAMGQKELAALLQLACVCVAAASVVQLIQSVCQWVASTRLYQILERFGRG